MSVVEKIRAAENLIREIARSSLSSYLNVVTINRAIGPARFGDVAEPWQIELLGPKIPAIEHLAGFGRGYRGPTSFLSVLARGHDKSSLEGRIASWLLFASKRQIHGYILASDKDQGQLILQAMEDEYKLNHWMDGHLTFRKNTVTGQGGFIEVLPADAASAYGLRGNLYIADEFTHWKNDRMWTAVLSGREKIPGSLLIVLSNAGLRDSWQHKVRLLAEDDPDWVLFERPGQLATWMDKARVDKLRLRMPPSEGDRLFDNVWVDPAADLDYLRRPEVRACGDLGERLGLRYKVLREPTVTNYVAALDYAPRKDRTVFCVLHQDATGLIRIDRMDVWQGSGDDPVSIRRVEDHVRALHKDFRPKLWVVDPYQMAGTIENLQASGINVEAWAARSGQANYEAAQWLRQRIVNRTVAWPQDAELENELASLRVKRMSYGFRFDHETQKHDDRAVALCMAGVRAGDFPDEGPPISVRPLGSRL